jgi:hypothetical protein
VKPDGDHDEERLRGRLWFSHGRRAQRYSNPERAGNLPDGPGWARLLLTPRRRTALRQHRRRP